MQNTPEMSHEDGFRLSKKAWVWIGLFAVAIVFFSILVLIDRSTDPIRQMNSDLENAIDNRVGSEPFGSYTDGPVSTIETTTTTVAALDYSVPCPQQKTVNSVDNTYWEGMEQLYQLRVLGITQQNASCLLLVYGPTQEDAIREDLDLDPNGSYQFVRTSMIPSQGDHITSGAAAVVVNENGIEFEWPGYEESGNLSICTGADNLYYANAGPADGYCH